MNLRGGAAGAARPPYQNLDNLVTSIHDEARNVRCRYHRGRTGGQHCRGAARACRAARHCVRAREISALSHWRIAAAVQHESVYPPGAARKILARRIYEKARWRNPWRVLGTWNEVLLQGRLPFANLSRLSGHTR